MSDPSSRFRQSHPVSRRSRLRRQLILRRPPADEPADESQDDRSDAEEINPVVLPMLRLLTLDSDPLTGDSSDMSRYKRLLTQMPKIAGVINQFQSPEVQREVLQALIRAFESEDERRAATNGRTHDAASDRNGTSDDVLDLSRDDRAEPDLAGALLRRSDTDEEEGSSIHAL